MHADLIDQDDLLGQLRSLGFEVSSGANAKALVTEVTLRMTERGRSMAKPFTRQFRLCHARIAARLRELPILNFDQRLTNEVRQT